MSVPITISVEALTEQANAAMQKFFTSTNAGLNTLPAQARGGAEGLLKLRESSMAAREGFHGLESMVLLLGGEHFPMLARAVLSARMGLLTLRSATQLTGGALGTVAPVLGLVGAAVATGALLWHRYASASAKAAEETKKMGEALKQLPKFVGDVKSLVESKLLTGAQGTALLERIGALPGGAFAKAMQPRPQLPANGLWMPGAQPQQRPGAPKVSWDNPLTSASGYIDPDALRKAQEQLVKQGLMIKSGDEKNPQFDLSPQAEALHKIEEIQKQTTAESVEGYERERVKAKQVYDEQIKNLETLAAVAGHFQNADELAAQKRAAASTYSSRITAINFQEEKEKEQQASEGYAKRQEELNKIRKEEDEDLEDALSLYVSQEGKKREDIYQLEFKQRTKLLEAQRVEGVISERDYTRAVIAAVKERNEGRRKEAEDSKAIQDKKVASELAGFKGKQRLIEMNPDLTAPEKKTALLDSMKKEDAFLQENIDLNKERAQSMDLPPEARQKAEKEVQDLEQSLAEAKLKEKEIGESGTFKGEFHNVARGLADEWGSFAKQTAMGFRNVFEGAISSISDGISGLIMGTKTWGQALQEIASSILTSIVQTLTQMAVRMALMTALTTVTGFAEGGRPEVGKVSIVGEKGPELFVPDVPGTILPADKTAAMARSAGAGSGGASMMGSSKPSQFIMLDERRRLDAYRANPMFRKTVVEIMEGNRWRYSTH